MIKVVFFTFISLIYLSTNAQNFSFFNLGIAEKWWVLKYPSAALKAKKVSKQVIHLSDSIAKADTFPNKGSGGEKDAFRHALWIASLSKEMGSKKAIKLGKAHERTNRRDFKKGRAEEGAIPDSVAERMDLYNNEMGVEIEAKLGDSSTMNDLLLGVKQMLYAGTLKIVKMNHRGVSLNEKGNTIPQEQWEGKWNNTRVLVPSNYLLKDRNRNSPLK